MYMVRTAENIDALYLLQVEELQGVKLAHIFLGEGLAYGASVAAGTYSEGLLSGPAFVLGRLVGGYAGGILGGDFGGAISGVVFDYFYY